MRKFLAVVLLIMILVGLLPFVAGALFKRNYVNLLSNITYANGSKIQVLDYSQGWLTSEAKIYIPLKDPNDKTAANQYPDMPNGITVIQHIAHGPYLSNPITGAMSFSEAAIQSEVHVDDKIEKLLLSGAADASQGVMQINTVVSFFNNYLSQLQAPALTFKTPDKVFTWKGLSGTITADVVNNHIANIESDFKSGAFNIQSDKVTVAISAMSSQGKRTCGANGVCNGSASLTIPGITADQPTERVFKINSLNFDSSFDESNSYNSMLKITMNGLSTNDYNINSANFKFSTANVNVVELKKIIDKTKSLEGTYNGDPQSQGLALLAEYNADVPRLINEKTTLSEESRINTSIGNVTSTGKVFWPAGVALPQSPSDLIANLAFQLNARASATLIDQLVSQIDIEEPRDPGTDDDLTLDANVAPPSVEAEKKFTAILNDLVQSKQLARPIAVTLSDMQTQFVPMPDMSTYLQAQITSRAMPFNSGQQLRNAYQAVLDEKIDNIVDAIFSVPARRNKDLQIKINALLKEKVINRETAQGLMTLQSQALAPEIYTLAVHRFQASGAISTNLEGHLSTQYAAINKELSINADKAVDAAAADANNAPVAAEPGRVATMLAEMVQKGYVKRDKDDYVIALLYQKQALTLNGIAYVAPAVAVPIPGTGLGSKAPISAPLTLAPAPALIPAPSPIAQPLPGAVGNRPANKPIILSPPPINNGLPGGH